MKRGGAIVVTLFIAFACTGQTTNDEPPFEHAPADPPNVALPAVADAASEAPSDAIDAQLDSVSDSQPEASTDAATMPPLDAESDVSTVVDASAPSSDAPDATPTALPQFCEPMSDLYEACGAASCTAPDGLQYWSMSSGSCCVKQLHCTFGCISYPQGACCAPPTPECALGTLYAAGVPCPFIAKDRCFQTLAQACACQACQWGQCAVYVPGPSKIPIFKLPPKGGGSIDAAVLPWCPWPWTIVDASPPSDAEASAPPQKVVCSGVAIDAGSVDAATSD